MPNNAQANSAKTISSPLSGNFTRQSYLDAILKQKPHEVSTWRMFKIMAEFVQGFEFLEHIDKAATFFGSARDHMDQHIYDEATKLGNLLSKEGFAIVTGGGGGIMQAANKGAHEAGGISAGLNVKLPHEQHVNPYVNKNEEFYYFFVRKVMLSFASQVYVFFPGGFGTMDELFEMLTLIQTNKIPRIPVVLVNREFWTPLVAFIEEHLDEKYNTIKHTDRELYTLVDTAEEACAWIKQFE